MAQYSKKNNQGVAGSQIRDFQQFSKHADYQRLVIFIFLKDIFQSGKSTVLVLSKRCFWYTKNYALAEQELCFDRAKTVLWLGKSCGMAISKPFSSHFILIFFHSEYSKFLTENNLSETAFIAYCVTKIPEILSFCISAHRV